MVFILACGLLPGDACVVLFFLPWSLWLFCACSDFSCQQNVFLHTLREVGGHIAASQVVELTVQSK